MNVCGVLVHSRPDHCIPVEAALEQMPGVEVHGKNSDSRIIITVEDTPDVSAIDGLAAIHKVSGVIAAALVYHHFEPEEEAGERSKEN